MTKEITVTWIATGAVAHKFNNLKDAAKWYLTKGTDGVFGRPLAVDTRDIRITNEQEIAESYGNFFS